MSQITRCCVFSQTLSKLRPAANRISHISSLYSKTYDNKRVASISRCFSTNQKNDKSSLLTKTRPPAKDSAKKTSKKNLLKRYGLPLIMVDGFLFAVSTGVFYILLSRGVEMTEILAFLETYVDIDNWVNKINVDKSILTGNGSKLVISLCAAELTTPLRIPFDMGILYLLRQRGIIGESKPK